MRIISGKYRGKHIFPPSNFKARPTTDFAKESLFNIINNNFTIENVSVLDLFSGTGSISYEFASRGCNQITAVENKYQHFLFIHKMVQELNFNQIKVIYADVFKLLKKINDKFDIIFADPPYTLDNIDKLPDIVFEKKLVNSGGWMILEHSNKYNFSNHSNFKEVRDYGSVNFSIFTNMP